jgi:hypothetical protein
MAIASARVQINGAWHSLAYNSSTGKWEATITAPSITSFNQSGGYYPVTVEATNTASTKTTVTTADLTVGNSLKLVVKEKVAPSITIISPSAGSYFSNNKQPIVFTLRDEVNGSGIKLSTLRLKIDGGNDVLYNSMGMTYSPATNGYDFTYIPPAALADGAHTVIINVADNDGNTAIQKSVSYTIDTMPPTLNVTNPANSFIVATPSITVQGQTNDATSSSVTVDIKLNGVNQGTATVDAGGNFSKAITLAEGANTVVVKSTDGVGQYTEITITGVLDTTSPIVSGVTIAPNPIDAGATMLISVVIE